MEQRDARQTDAALWRSLPGEDRVAQALRALYESLGYRRYRAASFESYDFYLENKSFVECEAVLPFTDASGRLLALKPDVTMSIVKMCIRDRSAFLAVPCSMRHPAAGPTSTGRSFASRPAASAPMRAAAAWSSRQAPSGARRASFSPAPCAGAASCA